MKCKVKIRNPKVFTIFHTASSWHFNLKNLIPELKTKITKRINNNTATFSIFNYCFNVYISIDILCMSTITMTCCWLFLFYIARANYSIYSLSTKRWNFTLMPTNTFFFFDQFLTDIEICNQSITQIIIINEKLSNQRLKKLIMSVNHV